MELDEAGVFPNWLRLESGAGKELRVEVGGGKGIGEAAG